MLAEGTALELVTNTGAMVAAALWLPLGAVSPLVVDAIVPATKTGDGPLVTAMSILLLPAVATALILRSWFFRRVVQVSVTRAGLRLRQRGVETLVPLGEIGGVTLFELAGGAAYGLDVVRVGQPPLEIRAWDPTRREALFVQERLLSLLANAPAPAPGDPTRSSADP